MKKVNSKILIAWNAPNNDPYERETTGGNYRLDDNGNPVLGPNLSVLFDPLSEYCNQIDQIILFYRDPGKKNKAESGIAKKVLRETVDIINSTARINKVSVDISLEKWDGMDPTDHEDIFKFVHKKLAEIRNRFLEKELIIHISPGTPATHTIWVLMAETGYIKPPFRVIKSYRRREMREQAITREVRLNIETFYKVYQQSWPNLCFQDKEEVTWQLQELKSNKMSNLFQEAKRIARLNVPVLIMGERGTGKTTLANWIRANSGFRKKDLDHNWPAIACGQFTNSQLMQAELFGYVEGAFTGALKGGKIGLIEKADGDTLFLDEIGDIDRDLQRLLIKTLEEKQFFPLGSTKPKKSNFRLISATNKSLEALEKILEPDFLDRISVFRVYMPPLREIPEEIPQLWNEVLKRAIKNSGVEVLEDMLKKVNQKNIINLLLKQPLYGNLRDVYRVAYRLIAAIADSMDHNELQKYVSEEIANEQRTDDIESHIKMLVNAFVEPFINGKVNKLSTESVMARLKKELAEKLIAVSRDKKLNLEDISDLTKRTSFNWLKAD